jgi:DNA-binding NtrC family response regulator
LHPIVAQFIKHEKYLIDILKESPPPRTPLVEAMLVLRETQGEGPRWQEFLAMEQQLDPTSEDPDLYLLYLYLRANMALGLGHTEEAGACLQRADALTSPQIPIEIRAQLSASRALFMGVRGDQESQDRLMDKAIGMLPESSPHYWVLVSDRANMRAARGELSEFLEDLNALLLRDPGRNREWVAYCRLRNSIETVELREALAALSEVSGGLLERSMFMDLMDHHRLLLHCLCRRWHLMPELDPGIGILSDASTEVEPDEFIRSTDSLLAGNPSEALRWARVMFEKQPDYHLKARGFASYTPVRAELAAGNGEAARRLMQRRAERGNRTYLDDFFMARIERLSGNWATAAGHLDQAARAAERYGAGARLDFELRLSCELAPGDLFRISRLSASLPGSRRPAGPRQVRPAHVADGLARIIGDSPATRRLREEIARLAALDVPVLIRGETGTGKELVARVLHELGPRARQSFIALNCGAISEGLLESELFGHERGAFTGAGRAHKGIFEEAGGGTVLLDEIGEISPRLQVALLRVLESGEIRPVGASRQRKVSCRILAATNADLEEMAERLRFRRDLLYRLKRMELCIPVLDERREDIALLAEHFLSEGREDGRRPVMSDELRRELESRSWPGNVRELKNTMERMRLLNSDQLAYGLDSLKAGLPPETACAPVQGTVPPPVPRPADPSSLDVRSALRRDDGLRGLFREHRKLRRTEIMRLLGVSPATATRDLKRLLECGFIEKVRPTPSPRSHYFRIREE